MSKHLCANFLTLLAPYAQQLNLEIISADEKRVIAEMPKNPMILRDIGIVCGQSIMAAIDSLGVTAIIAQQGEYRDMTTVDLQCNFIRAIPPCTVVFHLSVLRLGRKISVVRCDVYPKNSDEIAVTATITYCFIAPPKSKR